MIDERPAGMDRTFIKNVSGKKSLFGLGARVIYVPYTDDKRFETYEKDIDTHRGRLYSTVYYSFASLGAARGAQ